MLFELGLVIIDISLTW